MTGIKSVVCISNPLPLALAHYEKELRHILRLSGMNVLEGNLASSTEGKFRAGLVSKGLKAIANIMRIRSTDVSVIHLWPSLGLPEVRLAGSKKACNAVVLHDPIPLHPQAGYGAHAKNWVKGLSPDGVEVIVHSPEAYDDARRLLPLATITLLPHPVLNTLSLSRAKNLDEASVAVVGQYKPSRDLEMLVSLAPLLKGAGIRADIFGRGWPSVDGWHVHEGFRSELEIEEILQRASVVLLPYRRYYQSGIAIRALECGTPVVGSNSGFLRQLYGGDSDAISRSPSVVDVFSAVSACLCRSELARDSLESYHARAVLEWSRWLREGDLS